MASAPAFNPLDVTEIGIMAIKPNCRNGSVLVRNDDLFITYSEGTIIKYNAHQLE